MKHDSTRDIESHIDLALQHWANSGSLTPEQSFQLERLVYQMSHKDRKSRTVSVLRGTIAAIAAYITMLFLACPAAGSVLPAAEVLARHEAFPLAAQVEKVAYNTLIPSATPASITVTKGARS